MADTGSIQKQAEVEFSTKGNWEKLQKFSAKDNVLLIGKTGGESATLALELMADEDSGGRRETEKFNCKSGSKVVMTTGAGENQAFSVKMTSMGNTKLMNDGNDGITVNVSYDCSENILEGGKATCDLKVTTAS